MRRFLLRPRLTALAIGALLAAASAARASEFSDDLSARRARVAERLGADTVLVLWSAPPRTYSLDIEYEYRQESNLYYLTGITQEDTILVLNGGQDRSRDVLFVKEQDPAKEHWYGRLLSTPEASARTGIQSVATTGQFDRFVDGLLSRHAVRRVALLLSGPDKRPEAGSAAARFVDRLRERFPAAPLVDATPILTDLRTVKTPYEQGLLVKGLAISSDAQRVGMRSAHPGAYEYEVKAAIEGAYRGQGATSWAYPSIVGSGPNATILHYQDGDRRMQAGELLLVDAAANYQYLAGDITRTYPVDGRFTDAQKAIYEIVLRAQDEALTVAHRGSSLAAIHDRTVVVIKAGLLALGLITDAEGDQYKMWYTHSSTHYIGIDVHDVGDRTRPLQPGMAFTIEPGIYIRQDALDALPKTPENLALIGRISPAVRRYLNIGVRVEDSFLLEDSGPRRLSASVPRTIAEIEAFMGKK